MSWAAHNPEAYDEIVRKGILEYIDKQMSDSGFSVPGEWLEGYEALIEVLQYDPKLRSIYDAFMHLGNKHIMDAEQSYFSSLHGE